MTLVYGSPNQSISLRVRSESGLTLERAATLQTPQAVADYPNLQPLRLSCVYAPANPDPTLGLEETMSHLITLGAALRDAVRLDATLGGQTYTRTLRPGGLIRVQRLQVGVAEYELELFPGEPWWRDTGGNPVVLGGVR